MQACHDLPDLVCRGSTPLRLPHGAMWDLRLFFSHACRCSRVPKSQAGGNDKAGEQQQGLSEHDKQLGNALTLVQLGHWPEAASSFAQLNRFYAEMYQQASVSSQLQGTPPQHNSGKAQLNIEEWISCMKQLNRRAPLIPSALKRLCLLAPAHALLWVMHLPTPKACGRRGAVRLVLWCRRPNDLVHVAAGGTSCTRCPPAAAIRS